MDAKILADLNIEQAQRLIRYLGGYMDPFSGPKPLKLRNAGRLESSWPVSTLAAEIVYDWPDLFQYGWTRMQDQADGGKTGLNGLFRQAYYYLYRGLKESAFLPVREAFEQWLGEHWRGGLSKRNRRLTDQLLANAQWIPGKAAAEQLGVSIGRLRTLVREGAVDGQESISSTGRRFLVVRRDQQDQIRLQLADELTMTAAMEMLGIGKVRMQRTLKLLFPNARRINGDDHMPWCVPRSEVETLLEVARDLPTVSIPDEDQVSLAHVFKYWTWTAEEIVALIEAVRNSCLSPISSLDTARGIARWIFDRAQLRAWHAALDQGQKHWLTIPEAARALRIKEEVAYWLTRNGYLATTEKLGSTKKLGARIRREDLDQFRAQYIFGTEIAELLKTSPKKIARRLAAHGIRPIWGDSPDPCRKLIFSREEVLDLISKADRLQSSLEFVVEQ